MLILIRSVIIAALAALPSVLLAKSPRAVHDPYKSRSSTAAVRPEPSPLQKDMDDLKSADVVKRREAANHLGVLRSPHAVPALVVALSDEDVAVRAAAARTLGLMKSSDGTRELARVLETDPDSQVRQSAAVALGFIADPNGTPALRRALKDPDAAVKNSAAASLGLARAAAAVPDLTPLLKSPAPDLRRAAARSLGQIGEASAAPALQGALKDRDVSVQVQAVWAMGELRDRNSAKTLKKLLDRRKAPELRVAAAAALAKQEDFEGRPAALEVLTDRALENRPRLEAVRALALMKDPSLAAPLREVSAAEPEGEVKKAVALLLENIPGAEVP